MLLRNLGLFVLGAALGCAVIPGYGADIFKGRELYGTHCEACHGPDGRGVMAMAPDFTRGTILVATDIALFQSIRGGKGAMPAYRGILSEQETLDVIAYMRTFR